MDIDPAWKPGHGAFVAEVESWVIAPAEDSFAPNVNVLTQTLPYDVDLSAYLDLSVDSGLQGIADFELIDQLTVPGPSGRQLGLLEYTGTMGGRSLHFLQLIDVSDRTAIVATLTTPPATFDAHRLAVEPYLRTLEATS